MITTHPVALKSIAKVPNQKVARWPKSFSSSSSSSADGLFQICMTLSRWFSHKTAAFFTEQCTSPLLSSRFEVTRGDPNCPLKNYGFLYNAIFFFIQIAELEMLLVCRECLKKAWSGQ